MSSLFPPLSNETRRTLICLSGLIDKVFPLPGRFRAGLPRDVAELSRLLTADRQDRSASYLGKPALLSAYLRYFMPWNIYRLCRLLSALPLDLKSHDTVNDLGAGPLTLAASLWITRPDLRKLPLEFRCVDRTPAILEAGKKFFLALASETGGDGCPWVIKTIRGELKRHGGLSVEIKGKPAALTTAINVYNELFWNFSPLDREGLGVFADRAARLLSSLTEPSGAILVMEPGIPRSGEFVSLLRSSLMDEGRDPLSPCVHSGTCPLPGVPRKAGTSRRGSGTKAKWCHFAFDTEDAPDALHRLSYAAGIPKERAVLSFILAGPVSPREGLKNAKTGGPVKVRVISDAFPVGEAWGRYGCGECGLVLVKGSRRSLENSPSGALEELQLLDGVNDEKSGAFVARKL
ncbi:MAG: rRNA methyltransferase [Treponema sp.]|nr:rRNA methyltransferase [Treponema sp.]